MPETVRKLDPVTVPFLRRSHWSYDAQRIAEQPVRPVDYAKHREAMAAMVTANERAREELMRLPVEVLRAAAVRP